MMGADPGGALSDDDPELVPDGQVLDLEYVHRPAVGRDPGPHVLGWAGAFHAVHYQALLASHDIHVALTQVGGQGQREADGGIAVAQLADRKVAIQTAVTARRPIRAGAQWAGAGLVQRTARPGRREPGPEGEGQSVVEPSDGKLVADVAGDVMTEVDLGIRRCSV